MRSRRGSPTRYRSDVYLVSDVSRLRMPFSQAFIAAYANAVLLADANSKTVSSSTGTFAVRSLTPNPRDHSSFASATIAIDTPGVVGWRFKRDGISSSKNVTKDCHRPTLLAAAGAESGRVQAPSDSNGNPNATRLLNEMKARRPGTDISDLTIIGHAHDTPTNLRSGRHSLSPRSRRGDDLWAGRHASGGAPPMK